ncbi:hypothetical protein [Aquimarina sp. I32.4]|uniref:hypothetical protein n=1 Tax=Aquimarina sp. I32.4 TaxID=2053903 RepID=UPI0011AF40B3|nr:hypothetical protein [Aquimarina sp. I32.4]
MIPFDNPVTPYASDLTFSNTISCSYSSSYTEFMTIPNAEAGEYYLVLITNFSQMPGFINFQKTGGIGVTDCSILEVLLGPNQIVCEGETVALNGTTDGAVSYEWAVFNESTSVYDTLIGEITPFLNVTASGRYQISVEDTEGDVVTDEIEIRFVDKSLVNPSVPDLVECASSVMNQDISFFDLTKNDVHIPETSNPNYKIVYYANEADYNIGKSVPESEISSFKNTNNPQSIYASIMNTALDCGVATFIRTDI